MANFKKWTVVIVALIGFSLSSCTKTEIIEKVETVEPYTYTKTFKVYAEDMYLEEDIAGSYFEYTFNEPKLTKTVFDYGIMQAFLYYPKNGTTTLCPLPFSDFLVDQHGNQWEEQFTVEFQVGAIRFIQKISDHNDVELPVAEYYEIMVRFLW